MAKHVHERKDRKVEPLPHLGLQGQALYELQQSTGATQVAMIETRQERQPERLIGGVRSKVDKARQAVRPGLMVERADGRSKDVAGPLAKVIKVGEPLLESRRSA